MNTNEYGNLTLATNTRLVRMTQSVGVHPDAAKAARAELQRRADLAHMSIRDLPLAVDDNLTALEGIALQAVEAKNELDSAEYRFGRTEEFANMAIKSGYWSVDLQDARRDLRDAEDAMARARVAIDNMREALDRL